jgi:23S rRNA pseudouridine2604 synthase
MNINAMKKSVIHPGRSCRIVIRRAVVARRGMVSSRVISIRTVRPTRCLRPSRWPPIQIFRACPNVWRSSACVRVVKVVDVLGTRIAPEARIEVSKAAEKHQSEIVTILLHKPVGYVSGQAEDGYEPAVVLVHPDNQWEEDPVRKTFQRGFLKGLAPAGRLDIDSTGMLVLTQDGRVARQLIGEDSTTEKEYLVRVEGGLSAEGLKKLNFGLELDGVPLKPAKVSWQNEDQLRFVLREGKKRQIRRMCELVGLHVVGLKRVRIGSVTLGKLPVGQWRYLRPGERF